MYFFVFFKIGTDDVIGTPLSAYDSNYNNDDVIVDLLAGDDDEHLESEDEEDPEQAYNTESTGVTSSTKVSK